MHKTAIFGATGYLGRHFYAHQKKLGHKFIATSNKKIEGFNHFDLLDMDLKGLDLSGHEFAMISIAMTSVKKCEENKELSYLCNVTNTLALSEHLSRLGITPIVFSSDYVFDGREGGYLEEDPPCPMNEYGRQKMELEKAISKVTGGNYLLIRLSKIYSDEKGDKSLLDELTMHLYQYSPVRAAQDQIFCPIHIYDVINCICLLQKTQSRGIFNLASTHPISRYELALQIAYQLDRDEKLVQSIGLEELNEDFVRPKNTSLKNHKIMSLNPRKFIPLNQSIQRMCNRYLNS